MSPPWRRRGNMDNSLVWRWSVQPSLGASMMAQLRHRLAEYGVQVRQVLYDWGGSLIWLTTNFDDPSIGISLREIFTQVGGQAVLIRAPREIRQMIGVWPPMPPAMSDLQRRIKLQYDPKEIFNRGRMGWSRYE